MNVKDGCEAAICNNNNRVNMVIIIKMTMIYVCIYIYTHIQDSCGKMLARRM